MDEKQALAAFGALSQDTRLRIVRLLVQAGPEGLAAGAVGEAAGIQLVTWELEMDLPDPEAVLADPDAFELPERGDRAHAVLSAVAAAVAAAAQDDPAADALPESD